MRFLKFSFLKVQFALNAISANLDYSHTNLFLSSNFFSKFFNNVHKHTKLYIISTLTITKNEAQNEHLLVQINIPINQNYLAL
jgi:hypothetical protein